MIFVASFSFRVGQERMGLTDGLASTNEKLIQTNKVLVSHVESDDEKWVDQETTNKDLRKSMKSLENNTGIMRNDIDWIKKRLGG